jgi:hypothetical protein
MNRYRNGRFGVLIGLLVLLLTGHRASAHVGSAGVVVQKQAGRYTLLVSVQPPDVVPGTAKVTVFVEQGRVAQIGARPVYFLSGDEGAPTHDALVRQPDGSFAGDLWLMSSGSSSVELSIDGPDGRQKLVVPVVSVATALRDMPAGTGMGLAAMGLLLVAMLVTIVGASNADGVFRSGQATPTQLRRRRLAGMGVGLVLITLIMTGWRSWWTSTATRYRQEQLYQKPALLTTVQPTTAGGQPGRQLLMQIDTTRFGERRQLRRPLSFMIPDHGKLMHTFLVRTPGLDAFAHLHPTRLDSVRYTTGLPPLPAGRYLLYSDVVYRSGFSETLTDTIDLPAPQSGHIALSDADDSWLITAPQRAAANTRPLPYLDNTMASCGKPGASAPLADGATMVWMDKPAAVLEAGRPYVLKFAVADSSGRATALQPYLGMSGHGVILRNDGSVYIHLHPVGTYSMAAEQSFVNRLADTTRQFHYPDATQFRDSIDRYVARLKTLPEAEKNRQLAAAMPTMRHAMLVNNLVSFPYSFPRAGRYRIWVQVKRQGRVLTGVFDTDVNDPLL